MTTKSRGEILGIEYDWLASDGHGHVAVFTTAGGSYAPEEFLRNTEEHDQAIEVTLALPPSTTALFAPKIKENLKNTWLELAARGFFGFDGDPNGGPYRKVSAPQQPAHVDDLPLEPAAVVRRLLFSHLNFATLDWVTSAALGESE